MKENTPLKTIPLPDYNTYRVEICRDHTVTFPLKAISCPGLGDIPLPINSEKKGWPWDKISYIGYTNSKLPKISVVIPSYQQGRYIEETIRSILLQNYPCLEIIIIDAGSTDETISVVNHYKDFISLFISEKDKGQSQAINKGFSMASGELYYWVNSDDYLNINSLNKVASHFLKNHELDIIYGDGLMLIEETGCITMDYAPLVLERYLRMGGIILSHSVVWKSRVHCAVWEDLQCAMDAELWLRLFTGRKTKHCRFPIGTARVHSMQKTFDTARWKQKWKDDYEKYIWVWYPAIQNWKLRVYEYRIIQSMFRKYRDLIKG